MAPATDQKPRFVLRGRDDWRDPWPDYARLRDEAPVLRVAQDGDCDFYVLSRFADIFDAARDTATFSSAQGLTPNNDAMAHFEGQAAPIVMMDPPDHTAMRRLVSRPMTPRRVALIEDAVRRFVDDRLDLIGSDGRCDIIDVLCKPLPSFVVAHYLGVPVDDRVGFDTWTAAIVAAGAEGDVAGALDAFMEMFEYANHLIELRRRDPGDDLVSDLVAAGEDMASPEWIVGFVFTMVTGGNDTMTGLLGGTAELLTDRRDQRQLLVDHPSLIEPAIDEFLRLTSPVQNLARTTTRPVELHGVRIPEGEKVLLLYGSGNRDEREFGPTAAELDVRRDITRILSFSYGPHHCLGAAAARLQGRVAVERLLQRFPDFSVDVAGGRFAAGPFVRRYESLPFATGATASPRAGVAASRRSGGAAMAVDESNRVQADFWAAAGSMWTAMRDRFDAQVNDHGLAAIEALAPVLGESIIDVGCGAGTTTAQLARRVGSEGHVTGLDISPAMIEGAAAHAAEHGLTNVGFRVGDAMIEPFAPDADGVFSRFGVMFFSDATTGFANLRSALRPGGRLAFVCWQSPLDNPWVSRPLAIAGEYVEIPFGGDPTAPGPFSLGDPDHLRTVLTAAGFVDVVLEPFEAEAMMGADLPDAVDFMCKLMPPVAMLEADDPDRADELRSRLHRELADWEGSDGVRAPSAVWIVTARQSG